MRIIRSLHSNNPNTPTIRETLTVGEDGELCSPRREWWLVIMGDLIGPFIFKATAEERWRSWCRLNNSERERLWELHEQIKAERAS